MKVLIRRMFMRLSMMVMCLMVGLLIIGCGGEGAKKKGKKGKPTSTHTEKAELRKLIKEALDDVAMSDSHFYIEIILNQYDDKQFDTGGDIFLNDVEHYGAKELVRDKILLYRKMCKREGR